MHLKETRSPSTIDPVNVTVVVFEDVSFIASAGVVISWVSQTQAVPVVEGKVRITVPPAHAPLALKLPAISPPCCVFTAHDPDAVGCALPISCRDGTICTKPVAPALSVTGAVVRADESAIIPAVSPEPVLMLSLGLPV